LEFYREGRLEGEVALYWPNGTIKRKCPFAAGVRQGLDQMWNEFGQLLDEGRYERGKSVGAHRRFSQAGQLLEEIVYLDSHRFNTRRWDEKGELRVEAIWTDEVHYQERTWDRFQNIWIEKEGLWNGKRLAYC